MFKFKSGIFEPKTKEKIIKDTFFGGAEKAAAKKQERAIGDAQNITRESADRARADLNRLFPQAQQTAQQGFQGALDVFGQSLPAQTDVFQQGNIGAQQAILAGLPQIQNALLGGNVDFSQLQPFRAQQPDLSFFQQQLPQLQQQQLQQQEMSQIQQQPQFSGFNQGVNKSGTGLNFNNLLGGNFNLSNSSRIQ